MVNRVEGLPDVVYSDAVAACTCLSPLCAVLACPCGKPWNRVTRWAQTMRQLIMTTANARGVEMRCQTQYLTYRTMQRGLRLGEDT